MANYPALQEQKSNEPIDLSNINYPISERFMSAFSNTYESSQYNFIVNNRPLHTKPVEGYPGTFPATQEYIEQLKLERPGLPNIPVGVPKYIADATASLYDNNRNLALMKEASPSILGYAAAFGGSAVASFLDLKSL